MMKRESTEANLATQEPDLDWTTLYQQLQPIVRYWVYRHSVPSWRGQEEDIISEIVQEALVRTWKYLCRAEQGEALRIHSLLHFSQAIALNYGRDLRKHDYRLTHADDSSWKCGTISECIEDVAMDHLGRKELYSLLAIKIKDFPAKQKEALLIDLAQRMSFTGPPTELQQAFLRVGICLSDYQHPLLQDTAARNRYWTLLSIAYKRLRSIMLSPLAISF